MDKDKLKKVALAVYTPPFKYDGVYIWDANHKMVADDLGGSMVADEPLARIRGWGNLTGGAAMNLTYEQGAEIQDQLGHMLADALTHYWKVMTL